MHETIIELSLLAADLAGASRAIVTKFCPTQQKHIVVANPMGSGSCNDWINQQPTVCKDRPVILLDDDAYVLQYKPSTGGDHIKRLAAFLIHDEADGKYALSMSNPSQSFFNDDKAVTAIERIARIMSPILNKNLNLNLHPESEATQIVEKTTADEIKSDLHFLLDTLLVKQRLLTRGDVSYLALRQWKRSVKSFQVKTMTNLKAEPTALILDTIANELTQATRSLYGNTFTSVVPVPGGSSGSRTSFSVEIARRVATLLRVDFNNVLAGQIVPLGASHPKKSILLKPYNLLRPVKGNVLIIDDVATSGRHLELATQAVRKTAKYSTAVVWIAD